MQNFPVVTYANSLHVEGTLHSTPNTTFTIDFYSQIVCDPSHYGEGEIVHTTTVPAVVTTNATGDASFTYELTDHAFGYVTATGPDGSTSEFLLCKKTGGGTLNPLVVTSTEPNGTGSLKAAVDYANAHGGRTITFRIDDSGPGPFVVEIDAPTARGATCILNSQCLIQTLEPVRNIDKRIFLCLNRFSEPVH
jgi:hypothetical protein